MLHSNYGADIEYMMSYKYSRSSFNANNDAVDGQHYC